ncbi:MAG: hypothetical protein LBG43_09325 [Treponema sp.]|jgi:hypothetical protein|nr:hypothetical protein [Treponema sp.]
MRKILLLLLSLVFSHKGLRGLENAYLILGNVSGGLDTDFSSIDYYMSLKFLDFNLQGRGAGMSFSPFIFKWHVDSLARKTLDYDDSLDGAKTNLGSLENFTLTLINSHVYYNFLKNKHFLLGPFLGVNALCVTNMDVFEITAGIVFSVRGAFERFSGLDLPIFFELLQIQMGYKYNNERKGQFFAQISLDLTFFFASAYKDETIRM